MTTENTHLENNDWQEPVVEQLSVSETSTPPKTLDAPLEEEQTTVLDAQSAETLAVTAADGEMPVPGDEKIAHQEEPFPVRLPADQEAWTEQQQEPAEIASPLNISSTAVDEQPSTAGETSEQPGLVESDSPSFFTLDEEAPLVEEEAVRPFTDFIEEFRQTEVRLNTLLQEPESSFDAFVTEGESTHDIAAFPEVVAEDRAQAPDEASVSQDEVLPQEKLAELSSETEPAHSTEQARPGLTQPTLSAERPVSPLLRPATRIRLPRHGRHRIEELIQPAEHHVEPVKPVVEQPAEETPATENPQVEEQPARPARRYRFDRPAATASAHLSAPKPATPPPPVRGPEIKDKRSATFAIHAENGLSVEPATVRPGINGVVAPEAPAQKATPQEAAPASVETPAPTPPAPERRRRGNQERQREKEQAASTAAAAAVTPAPEVAAPEAEPAPVSSQEVPLEDLPPLEYSELQAASSRRRRRRRTGSVGTTVVNNGVASPKAALPDLLAPVPTPTPAPAPPTSAVALPKSMPAAPVAPPVTPGYNIVSGYTVSQMNQGNDVAGPFMGPEPSPARGSTFGSTPQLRHVRNEALRTSPVHTPKQVGDSLMSTASVNHLANAVSQAIQNQTDRMLAELRRANQVPTNISVSLPPFPSNERVGVFVDVANLLYSARTLRMTIDFGKLLDFLRGNRRLVRAQAYCPTSPQPGDDQMFLQAVKGLGYRITTKNYKTFSSGAKKADLDLDLCMDVVRLVDGKAVDCIVLVSGDSDFMPMLDYCSDHGVRVEVAAFDESMSATLRQSCDLFVNLSMLEEIRA